MSLVVWCQPVGLMQVAEGSKGNKTLNCRRDANTRHRDSYREVFKSMEIMTLYSQYIYSLVLYTVNNKHLFDTNNEIHKYKTRNNNNLHLPITNLSKFNKGAYISGIKVFNHLPQYIKALTNDHKYFKSTLERFLYHHSFYSMNEYYEYKECRRI